MCRFLRTLEENVCSEEEVDEGTYKYTLYNIYIYMYNIYIYMYNILAYCSLLTPHPPDVDVSCLQLLLFVWHSFTALTRASLLTQCAHAVIKAGRAKE